MFLRTLDNTKDSELQVKDNNKGSPTIYPAYLPERIGEPRWSLVISLGWGDRNGCRERPWQLELVYRAEPPWPQLSADWCIHNRGPYTP